MVMGQNANSKMVGEFTGLNKLDQGGNLVCATDYRSIYSSLLEQWLGYDAVGIIPNSKKMPRVKIVK